MKKIILNGCSWVAGDEIAWDLFCIENNLVGEDFYEFVTKDFAGVLSQYRYVFRPYHNLRSMLAQRLHTDVIDLSADGNSNDGMTINTMNYLLGLPKEERKNFHVIIGWTILQRKALFLDDHWKSLHVGHYGEEKYKKHEDRLLGAIVLDNNEDWYLNYFRNVMMLESFLKKENITFTFYRSLGSHSQFYNNSKLKISLKNTPNPKKDPFSLENFTYSSLDKDSWLSFYNDDEFTLTCESWTTYMQEFIPNWQVNQKNKHPGRLAMNQLADRMSQFIQQRNLLS